MLKPVATIHQAQLLYTQWTPCSHVLMLQSSTKLRKRREDRQPQEAGSVGGGPEEQDKASPTRDTAQPADIAIRASDLPRPSRTLTPRRRREERIQASPASFP